MGVEWTLLQHGKKIVLFAATYGEGRNLLFDLSQRRSVAEYERREETKSE